MVGGRGQAGGKGDLVPNLILPVHLKKIVVPVCSASHPNKGVRILLTVRKAREFT